MLKILLQKQLAEIFRSWTTNPKTGKARSRGATIGYAILFAVLIVGGLGGLFALLAASLCGAARESGMPWLPYSLCGGLAVLLGVFGSVFNTYSSLYLARDNDFLLSLPIPPGTIVAARLLGVYLMGLLYAGTAAVPCVIAGLFFFPVTPLSLLGGLLYLLVLSVVVWILSCLLGWVVAKISGRLRNKTAITVAVSLIFFGIYYLFCFRMQSILSELIENLAYYGSQIAAKAYPLVLFGQLGRGEPLAILCFAGGAALLAFLTWLLLARSFLGMASSQGAARLKTDRERGHRTRTPFGALLNRELTHYKNSAGYLLNCSMGSILMLVGGAALLWKGPMLREVLLELFPQSPDLAAGLLALAGCFLSSTNDLTAPSVSLEGRSIWIVQSLPVKAQAVLNAKLALHLILTLPPALFMAVCMAVIAPGGAASKLLILLLPVASAAFSACFGLVAGLKMPNLSWTNEITPIKQGGAVMLSLLGGWGIDLALIGLYLLLASFLPPLVPLTLIFLLLSAAAARCFAWLRKQGAMIFARL